MTNNNILIVAAHPDDEVLGCGGTIAKHRQNGDNVCVMFMTNGVAARQESNALTISQRKKAALSALNILGVSDVHFFDFPDNGMDSVPFIEIVQTIEQLINQVKPSTVYTHFAHDLNIDHRITHNAVMTACRPQKGASVKAILTFEVLSSTEWNSATLPQFTPQYIVDIQEFWELKINALAAYDAEIRAFPHSRSLPCIEALAVLRGASHGFEKAEAFFLERMLIR